MIGALPKGSNRTADRLVVSLGMLYLREPEDAMATTTITTTNYGAAPHLDSLVDLLISGSAFAVTPSTDYASLVASTQMLSLVLLPSLHQVYTTERTVLDVTQQALRARGEAGVLSRSELVARPLLLPLVRALRKVDGRIHDQRGNDPAKSRAKAFLLGLTMSVEYRAERWRAAWAREAKLTTGLNGTSDDGGGGGAQQPSWFTKKA